ncbi:hypothetical protein Hanom_Chr10g00915341 [Helianthus anomalus]
MILLISANKARQRLLRLSETAENLKRRAAVSVQAGKENEARDLLFQKKKVMQALDNTKSRIELLDELAAKLIEILKSSVRVMSPSSENSEKDSLNTNDNQEPQERPNELSTEHETDDLEGFLEDHGIDNNDDLISSLTGLTSFVDLLDRVDEQLNKVEAEAFTVMKFSNLILESEDRPTNTKVQQLMEILDAVQRIRKRYRNNIVFVIVI